MKTCQIGIFLFIGVIFFSGCAAHRTNMNHPEQGSDWNTTISQLEKQVEKNPDNIKTLQSLGLAYYKNLQFDKAIGVFQQVLAQQPDDGVALFYMGTAYELDGDLDSAIAAYRQYNLVNSNSSLRDDLEKRLHKLVLVKVLQDVHQALSNEAELDTLQIPDNSIAVVYFKYMGRDSSLLPLQKGLADMMITDLSKAQKLTVVERLKIQRLFEEMGLGTTGLVDAETAPRVGNLLGVEGIINGAFIDLADDQFRIDAGITGTRNGEFNEKNVSGKLQSFFDLEKQLVFGLIDEMGIELTQNEIDDIRKVPTENLLAFIAYCKAVDYRDRGMYDQANQQIQTALELDPGFDMAKEFQTETQAYSEPLEAVDMFVQDVETGFPDEGFSTALADVTPKPESSETPEAGENISENMVTSTETVDVQTPGTLEQPSIIDRLQNTQQLIDIGFVPGVESREPVQEQSQQTFGNTANIEISVPLPHSH